MSWLHFERMADDYASARPPYPHALFEDLESHGVIGPGIRVLEVGAGAGLATSALVASGSEVVALEPGPDLAALLRREVPAVSVVVSRLEDAALPHSAFDSVVAATSLHWVDLSVGLPKLHATLRTGGHLAVFRHIFGDDGPDTSFRRRVAEIVADRGAEPRTATPDDRPSIGQLTSGGWFELVHSQRWKWSIVLTTEQVKRLFRTFSDWSEREVEAVGVAAEQGGGQVTEAYQSVLHVLRRV